MTAGSSSTPAQIVIIGSGSSYDLTTNVPVADIGKVAVGQQAVVTPDATNSVVHGPGVVHRRAGHDRDIDHHLSR